MTMQESDLKNYDIIIAIDKSGSMGDTNDYAGKTRWAYAQETTEAIARKASQYDEDGITVCTFANGVNIYDNTTPEKVTQIFNENEPNGATNTALLLEKLFERYLANPVKPQIIVIVTDGEATDNNAVIKSIVEFTKKQAEETVSLLFLQIGKDAKAKEFLEMLDDNLKEKHGAMYDMVDCKTCDQIGEMMLADVFMQAILD